MTGYRIQAGGGFKFWFSVVAAAALNMSGVAQSIIHVDGSIADPGGDGGVCGCSGT